MKRAQRDALASGKRGSVLGVRQPQTHSGRAATCALSDANSGNILNWWEGRFCANPGAKALGRIPDTTGDPLLDLVAKTLLQNGSILP
ncbi:MAG: hypothetical protein ABJL64_18615 [Rhizobiaceae bacterium]